MNNTHLFHTLHVIQKIIDLYGSNPVVIGLEPGNILHYLCLLTFFSLCYECAIVNEPSGNTPWHLLKEFYHRVYQLITEQQSSWLVLLHDGYHLDETHWGKTSGFLTHCPRYAVDSHFYQAWLPPPTTPTISNDENDHSKKDLYISRVCAMKDHLLAMEALDVPIIVGEWSLAKDNCAMWLNGLNDNGKTYVCCFPLFVLMR